MGSKTIASFPGLHPSFCCFLLRGGSLGTYNFAALNRWDRFRVWLGHGTGLFSETFLKRCGGVTDLGTHISPNHLLERGYIVEIGFLVLKSHSPRLHCYKNSLFIAFLSVYESAIHRTSHSLYVI